MPTPPKSGTDFLRSLAGKAAAAQPREPECDVQSTSRSRVEEWLNSFGVKYTGPTRIALTDISVKESRGQQSRRTAIVEDTVQGVLQSLNDSRYVDPVVVFIDGGKATLIDGNNRDEAHRRYGAESIEAYVVDTDTPSLTIKRMLVAANAHHPQRPDLVWRTQQAADLLAIGADRRIAIRDANITMQQLSDYEKLVEADERAGELKIKDWTTLPDTSRRALNRIKMDAAFHAAARCAIDTGMTSLEVTDFQVQVRKHKSEGAMLALIEQARDKRIEAERGRRAGSKLKKDPKHNLSEGVGKIVNVDPVQLAQSCATDVDRRHVLNRINEALDHLGRLEAALTMKRVEL